MFNLKKYRLILPSTLRCSSTWQKAVASQGVLEYCPVGTPLVTARKTVSVLRSGTPRPPAPCAHSSSVPSAHRAQGAVVSTAR